MHPNPITIGQASGESKLDANPARCRRILLVMLAAPLTVAAQEPVPVAAGNTAPVAAGDTVTVRADGPPLWGEELRLVEEVRIGSRVPGASDSFTRIVDVVVDTSGVIWIAVMYLTEPESDQTLDEFYRRVRPGGPGWKRSRERTGLAPVTSLGSDLIRTLGAALLLFGLMFAVGGAMLYEWRTALIATSLGIIGFVILRWARPATEGAT